MSGVPGSNFSSHSVGDYLISSIHPSVEQTITRKAGLRLKRRIFRLNDASSAVQDFESYIRMSSFSLVKKAVDLPKWFNANDYTQRRLQEVIEWLESDHELSEAVKRIQGKRIQQHEEAVGSYAEAFHTLSQKLRESYERELQVSALTFLNSNMPDEYFLTLDSTETYFMSEIDVLARKSREFEMRLQMAVPRGFAMFSKIASEFKTEMSPVTKSARALSVSTLGLRFQVSLWNSDNMDEFFETRRLSKDRLPMDEFQAILAETQSRLEEARTTLSPFVRYIPSKFELADETKEFQRSLANVVLA